MPPMRAARAGHAGCRQVRIGARPCRPPTPQPRAAEQPQGARRHRHDRAMAIASTSDIAPFRRRNPAAPLLRGRSIMTSGTDRRASSTAPRSISAPRRITLDRQRRGQPGPQCAEGRAPAESTARPAHAVDSRRPSRTRGDGRIRVLFHRGERPAPAPKAPAAASDTARQPRRRSLPHRPQRADRHRRGDARFRGPRKARAVLGDVSAKQGDFVDPHRRADGALQRPGGAAALATPAKARARRRRQPQEDRGPQAAWSHPARTGRRPLATGPISTPSVELRDGRRRRRRHAGTRTSSSGSKLIIDMTTGSDHASRPESGRPPGDARATVRRWQIRPCRAALARPCTSCAAAQQRGVLSQGREEKSPNPPRPRQDQQAVRHPTDTPAAPGTGPAREQPIVLAARRPRKRDPADGDAAMTPPAVRETQRPDEPTTTGLARLGLGGRPKRAARRSNGAHSRRGRTRADAADEPVGGEGWLTAHERQEDLSPKRMVVRGVDARRRPRRGGRAAGAQRRRQDDRVLHDHRPRAGRLPAASPSTAATSRGCRCTAAPASASAICRRKPRSFAA